MSDQTNFGIRDRLTVLHQTALDGRAILQFDRLSLSASYQCYELQSERAGLNRDRILFAGLS